MKRMSVAVIVLSLAVSLFSMANAGVGGGCGNCGQQGVLSDPYRKFQADTIDLRQEMMMKRFAVQRENLSATPDNMKIAALQADIKSLQSKIMGIRSLSGLPNDKSDGECPQKAGGCCNKGMGGCNTGPCGGKK